MARRRVAGESLTGEEEQFLAECGKQDALFPELDLLWWAKLDRPPGGA
jgi:hypothetical protein